MLTRGPRDLVFTKHSCHAVREFLPGEGLANVGDDTEVLRVELVPFPLVGSDHEHRRPRACPRSVPSPVMPLPYPSLRKSRHLRASPEACPHFVLAPIRLLTRQRCGLLRRWLHHAHHLVRNGVIRDEPSEGDAAWYTLVELAASAGIT